MHIQRIPDYQSKVDLDPENFFFQASIGDATEEADYGKTNNLQTVEHL